MTGLHPTEAASDAMQVHDRSLMSSFWKLDLDCETNAINHWPLMGFTLFRLDFLASLVSSNTFSTRAMALIFLYFATLSSFFVPALSQATSTYSVRLLATPTANPGGPGTDLSNYPRCAVSERAYHPLDMIDICSSKCVVKMWHLSTSVRATLLTQNVNVEPIIAAMCLLARSRSVMMPTT